MAAVASSGTPQDLGKRSQSTLTEQEKQVVTSITTSPGWVKKHLGLINNCHALSHDSSEDAETIQYMQIATKHLIPITDIKKARDVAQYIIESQKPTALDALLADVGERKSVVRTGCGKEILWLFTRDSKPSFRGWNGRTIDYDMPQFEFRDDVLIDVVAILEKLVVCAISGESGIGKTGGVCLLPAYLAKRHPTVTWAGIFIPPPCERLDSAAPRATRDAAAEALVRDAVAQYLDPIIESSREQDFGGKVGVVLFLDESSKFGSTLIRGVIARHATIRNSLKAKYQLGEVHIVVAGTGVTLHAAPGSDGKNYEIYRMPKLDDTRRRWELHPQIDTRPMLWQLSSNYRCCHFIKWYLQSVQWEQLDELAAVRHVAKCYVETNGLAQFKDIWLRQLIFGIAWRALFDLPLTSYQAESLCVSAGIADDRMIYDAKGKERDPAMTSASRYFISPAVRLLLLDQFAESPLAVSPARFEGFWGGVLLGAIQALQQGAKEDLTIRGMLKVLNAQVAFAGATATVLSSNGAACATSGRGARRSTNTGVAAPVGRVAATGGKPASASRLAAPGGGKAVPATRLAAPGGKAAPRTGAASPAALPKLLPGASTEAMTLIDQQLPSPPAFCFSRKLLKNFEPTIGGDKVHFSVAFCDAEVAMRDVYVTGSVHVPSIFVVVNSPSAQFADIMLWVRWQSEELHVNIQLHQEQLSPHLWKEGLWVMGSVEQQLPLAVLRGHSLSAFRLLQWHLGAIDRSAVRTEVKQHVTTALIDPSVKTAILECVNCCDAAMWTSFAPTRPKPTKESDVTSSDIGCIFLDCVPAFNFHAVISAAKVPLDKFSSLHMPLPAPAIQIMAGVTSLVPPQPTSRWANGLTMAVSKLAPPIAEMWTLLQQAPPDRHLIAETVYQMRDCDL